MLFFGIMSQDQKREAIIEAAMKRFAHFGVAKTTMTEIAADLSFSKALLYYYFPDKINLLAAVVKQIATFNAHKYEELLKNEADPFKAIQQFLEIRTETIIKYHYILEYLKAFTPNSIPPELQPVFAEISQHELDRITAIIEKGKGNTTFPIADSRAAAELFHEYLEGYRYSFFVRNPNFFPDKKQFQAILKKEKKFSVIFLKGLTQMTE